jgi:pyrroline-5-carboxylate reductase
MAAETPSTLEALRISVTSPKGTTERALQAFEQGDLRGLVARAALAARDRSIELADELGQGPT